MRNMKLLIGFLAFVFLCLSCSQDEIVYPKANVEVAKTYLSLQQLKDNPLELSSESGTYILKVVSEKKWKVTSSENWCTLALSKGFKYCEIPINFSDNPWNMKRIAKLNFNVPETDEFFTLEVTQVAAETELDINIDNLVYGVGGGTQTVSLKTNATDCTIDIIDNNGQPITDWCKIDGYIGQGSADIGVTVEGNNTGAVREAKIIFKAEDKHIELPISQLEKFEAPVIELDDAVSFNLKWSEIVGVNGYELCITDGDGNSIEGVSNVSIPSGANSYNMSSINWGSYVGKIQVNVAAKMLINATEQIQVSNTLESHNYFDISSGDGSEGSPYIISKPRHLINIGKFLDAEEVSFKQICDIDFDGIDFEPIHNLIEKDEYKGEFKGTYDAGKGDVIDALTGRTSERYKIINLSINRTANICCGLFAKIGNQGIVRNLCIENPIIKGKYKIGSVAGESSGYVINCINMSNDNSLLYGDTGDGLSFAYVGGIVGNMIGGKIEFCINNCVINGKSGALGGIVGRVQISNSISPEISYCSNFAIVNTDIKTPVGGIVGEIGASGATDDDYAKIEYCYNEGDIWGSQPNNQVGGIIGRNTYSVKVNACYNAGNITAVGSAGGIIGRMGGTSIREINNCLNIGKISSTGNDIKEPRNNNSAGIVATGLNAASIKITNCLNIGELSAVTGNKNGIFHRMVVDKQKIEMSDCYAIDKDNVRQTDVSDDFIKNPESSYVNISESQAATQNTFNNWNFTDVWELTNGQYPTIKGLIK